MWIEDSNYLIDANMLEYKWNVILECKIVFNKYIELKYDIWN